MLICVHDLTRACFLHLPCTNRGEFLALAGEAQFYGALHAIHVIGGHGEAMLDAEGVVDVDQRADPWKTTAFRKDIQQGFKRRLLRWTSAKQPVRATPNLDRRNSRYAPLGQTRPNFLLGSLDKGHGKTLVQVQPESQRHDYANADPGEPARDAL